MLYLHMPPKVKRFNLERLEQGEKKNSYYKLDKALYSYNCAVDSMTIPSIPTKSFTEIVTKAIT